MRVYKYTDLDNLNAALEDFESKGFNVLAVKIFTKFEGQLGLPETIYFVIIDKEKLPKRFRKDVE